MRTEPIALVVTAVLLAGCQASAPCALRGAAEVLYEEGPQDAPGGKRMVAWELDDAPVLWSTARPASPSLARFVAEAERRAGDVSAGALLARAIAQAPTPRDGELARRLRAVVDRQVVPMRCFDALFLARQTERMDMVTRPSEVAAFVFRSGDGLRLRVLEVTVNAAGIGNIGRARAAVDATLARGGWRFVALFHNHNFFFEGAPSGGAGADWHGGGVAPSAQDAELLAGLHAELGLAEAWITNGFHTSVIPLATLAPPPAP